MTTRRTYPRSCVVLRNIPGRNGEKKNYCNGYAGIYSAGNMISTFTAVFHYESRWDFMKAFSVPYKFS